MQNQTQTRDPYYSSEIGLWYTVWWDSEERDPTHYEWHWLKETRVRPVKDGYYASDDPQKLWEDFSYFQRIGIDYLLLDDTNNHLADNGNIARHIDACFKTAEEMGRAPRMCLGGGSPLLNNDEPGMVAELNAFYLYAERYPDHFYFLDGKPLCVNFNLPDRYAWQDPHGRFTMRPAAGHTSEGEGCPAKELLDRVGMYGWVFDRQYDSSGVYGINPGWSRSHNGLSSCAPPLSRRQGEHYRRQWLEAVKRKPQTIVIASWNDHAEETGIEAVELLEPIDGRGEEDPFYYQRITEGYLALRTGYLENFCYQSEAGGPVYRYQAGRLRPARPETREAVILVPEDYFGWRGIEPDPR